MVEFKDSKLKRLISISEQICIENGALIDMTANNLENTEKFDEHIEKILNLLDKETSIIESLSLNKLNEFEKILYKYYDSYVAYNRLFQLIESIIEERTNNILDDSEASTEFEETNDELEDNETELPAESQEETLLDTYYMDTENQEKYLTSVIDRITIIVAKKMYQRISETEASTKSEVKYKKKLLKFFKEFKYYFFTLDHKLEKIGATYKYNIQSIPIPEEINEDLNSIYYNRCIDLLDTLYSTNITLQKNEILISLYHLMCIEEYIQYLDKDALNKLIDFCEELEITVKESFGVYGKIKVKQRLEKIS